MNTIRTSAVGVQLVAVGHLLFELGSHLPPLLMEMVAKTSGGLVATHTTRRWHGIVCYQNVNSNDKCVPENVIIEQFEWAQSMMMRYCDIVRWCEMWAHVMQHMFTAGKSTVSGNL
jgi:hypothetical protein